MELESASSLQAYFDQAVRRAIANQKVDATEDVTFYLVRLLAEFASQPPAQEALALLLGEGLQADPAERVQKLKEVGDTSLFVSGYFPESLGSSLVSVDYYIGMGEAAYGSLASLVRAHRQPWSSQVFLQLADQFVYLVDVIAEVSADAQAGSSAGLLRLYEKYLRTGSPTVALQLRKRGFQVKPGAA